MYARYFEYHGILQAVYIQQDAVGALYRLFFGTSQDRKNAPNWNRMRDLRNDTAGHPVGRRRFLNRTAVGYDKVTYSWWSEGDRFPKSEDVPLGSLLDGYALEAATVMQAIQPTEDCIPVAVPKTGAGTGSVPRGASSAACFPPALTSFLGLGQTH
jgi:hypothetical protein